MDYLSKPSAFLFSETKRKIGNPMLDHNGKNKTSRYILFLILNCL